MTDEQKLETEEQEVEAHGALSEPPFAAARADEGDDVEAHGALGKPALEPALEPAHAEDDDDVVEGHAAFGPLAKPDEPAL